MQAGNRLAEHLGGEGGGDFSTFLKLSRSVSRSIATNHSSTTSLQVLALQEELADTKERNAQLAMRLQQRETDLNDARQSIEMLTEEKEKLREKISEMEEEKLQMTPALSPKKSFNVPPDMSIGMADITDDNNENQSLTNVYNCPRPKEGDAKAEENEALHLLRMAERKKIRKMDDVDSQNGGVYHQQVTGSELSSVGVGENND